MAIKEKEAKGAATDLGKGDVKELTSALGYLLRRLQLLHKKNFLRIAGDEVHTSQVAVLMVIGHSPGITSSQISAQLGMEAAQVALVISKLELQGLVRRTSANQDGRRTMPAKLTARGERRFALARAISIEAERSFVENALSEDEQQQLHMLLDKLLQSHIGNVGEK